MSEGIRLGTSEIESALVAHAIVAEAAVVGRGGGDLMKCKGPRRFHCP